LPSGGKYSSHLSESANSGTSAAGMFIFSIVCHWYLGRRRRRRGEGGA